MKLSSQDVALVAVLIAGLIVAGVVCQAVVPTLAGIASTLIGAFFVNRPKDTQKGDAS